MSLSASPTDHGLADPASLAGDDIAARRNFLEIGSRDLVNLRVMHQVLESSRATFAEEFYRHMLDTPALRTLLPEPESLARLRLIQSEYFSSLTAGEYGAEYVAHRKRVGQVHQRIGLEPHWYIGAYRKYLSELLPLLWWRLDGDPERFLEYCDSLLKVVLFDIGLALDSYFEADREALSRVKEYAEQVVCKMPSGLVVLDRHGRVLNFNQAARAMLRCPDDLAPAGLELGELFPQAEMRDALRAVMEEGSGGVCLTLDMEAAPAARCLEVSLSPVSIIDQGMVLVLIQDITSSRRAEAKLRHMATHDELTGLPNRALLMDRVEQALANAERSAEQVAVLVVDVDRFKAFNDSLGLAGGDRLLVDLADRLRARVRKSDTVARLGGDQFVLVLSDIRRQEDVSTLAHEIQSGLAAARGVGGEAWRVTVSIGVSLHPRDGGDAETLLRNADAAMYRAKSEGGDTCRFFAPDMAIPSMTRLQLENELRRAVEHKEFVLHYQPQLEMESGRVVAVEALLRWRHPTRGLVSPLEFIPLSEETGLIVPIGEWVLAEVAAQVLRWREAGLGAIRIAVNLSPRQFRQPDFMAMLDRAIPPACRPLDWLELELTEGVLMDDPEASARLLRQLRDRGVRLAVDDFGTGYSSLSYLKRFPLDVLKIDRSFVQDIESNRDSAVIAGAVTALSHSLGLEVVAEGVENESQYNCLRTLHCDMVQGFLLGRPMPPEALGELLSRRNEVAGESVADAGRVLLLVDDEPSILSALERVFRRDGYRILKAGSGAEALALMEGGEVGVVVSDQRMPGMTGVEFLSQVRARWPDTVRIILSGYTELNSVTESVNKGAVFKFLTKPWEDQSLRECVRDAFQIHGMARENRRLNRELRRANESLRKWNRQLEQRAEESSLEASYRARLQDISQDVLDSLPQAVVGADGDGMVVLANQTALAWFANAGQLLGEWLEDCLPTEVVQAARGSDEAARAGHCRLPDGREARFWSRALGEGAGRVLVIDPWIQEHPDSHILRKRDMT